tara:strand:- start:734 stop:907 length:174 start_codon:yes stop_codon:yes gene_type:complete
MNDTEELKNNIDRFLSKLEDLRLDIGELGESSRVERIIQSLGEAMNHMCMLYDEVKE